MQHNILDCSERSCADSLVGKEERTQNKKEHSIL